MVQAYDALAVPKRAREGVIISWSSFFHSDRWKNAEKNERKVKNGETETSS